MAIVDVHEKFSRHTRKEKSLQINLDYGIWKSIGHGSEKQTALFEHGSRRVCCKQVPGTDRGASTDVILGSGAPWPVVRGDYVNLGIKISFYIQLECQVVK